MPTYDYECVKCGYTFEHFQSMLDSPLETFKDPEGCSHLKKGGKVRRMLGTGAGIIFKGSGFYETDYRSSEYKEAAKKDKETTNGSSKSSETSAKSDSKSETKSKSSKKKESSAKSVK
ncbi:MAG: zinc ribbon domain-containing protein [Candidatus Omnitrophica bacterium]|nr:zinc ribbon domain-containing protein [Candidatus Omnitrophota bacterium]MCA9417127.1 zinc ribbon domain-containing protein [Candidatus Omnitrophota bacterium]MCA9427427.1 zinc ribbon domain-containing protein [Candidatus Omnitrophota bacterium]MCA9431370.1 zinc ribbon domain-containing protein [Candidatus Omnitrophota bacterium]MCA9436944.1 zinc ribbon domain-containing protein [Candidatus Omnitrophota bacterium]